jgi:outer membrane protein TolC
MILLTAFEAWPADDPPAGPGLTLSAAIDAAQQQSFKIGAGRESVEAAKSDIGLSRAGHYPSLAALGSFSDYSGKVFVSRFVNPQDPTQPRPDPSETDVGPYNTTAAAVLRLTQTLYAGGATSAKVAGSRAMHKIAGQDLQQMRVDLTRDVTQAYYDVLLSTRTLDVAREALRRSEENLETVKRAFSEGEALHVQVLGAQSQLANDRQAVDVAQSNERFAQRALNRLMAREPDTPLLLTDTLEQQAQLVDETESVRLALENNPQARRAGHEVELAQAQIKGARSYYKPKLQIDAYVSYLDNEMLFKGTYFGANVNLTIPFVRDFAAGSSAVGKAEAGLRAQESLQRELRSSLTLLAQEAARHVKESQGAIGVAKEYLEYREERYRVAQTAFKEKLATFSEILDAHTDLSEAGLQLYQAYYQSHLAEAELRRLTGATASAAGGGSGGR